MKRYAVVATLVGALACTDSKVPNAPLVPQPPPDTAHGGSFIILPGQDTAVVGELVTLAAQRSDSTVDQWTTSDTNVARLSHQSRNRTLVSAVAPGTVIITASRLGDTGHATLVVRQPEKRWEAIDLGILDATSGYAFAVGDDGSVVGRLDGPGNVSHGFIYKNGGMRKLAASGADDNPSAIGPSGHIVGIAYLGGESLVIWDTPDAAPRRLGEPHVQRVVGINERGDVLVTTEPRMMFYRGVLWRNNVRVDLGDLGDSTLSYTATYANAWNTAGQIVGSSCVTAGPQPNGDPTCVGHPFLWENGVMRDLGVLASRPCTYYDNCSWGEATGINASGVVVGTSRDAEGRNRAFIWENGAMRDLGVAPGHVTAANAINDRGQIMGTVDGDPFFWENRQTQIIARYWSFRPVALGPNGEVIGSGMGGSSGEHALIWQAGRLIDLGPGVPLAINDRGEVIGWTDSRGVVESYFGSAFARPMLWRRKP